MDKNIVEKTAYDQLVTKANDTDSNKLVKQYNLKKYLTFINF